MSDDSPALPEGLDTLRLTKADGCVWEYRVRNLKLDAITVPEDFRKPGESIGSLEIRADEVFAMEQCGEKPARPPTPYDHVSLRVASLEASQAFYLSVLEGIGFELLYEFPGFVGLGSDGRASLWLAEEAETSARVHLCFEAPDRAAVDAFHAAALEAGGTCNGPPGLRPQYHPGYYAAFVFDPDGHNLELVFHDRVEAEEPEGVDGD